MVLGINTEQNNPDNTDQFIARVGFNLVLDDPEWSGYAQFGPGGAASRYVIINGVPDSPSHQQWEVLFNDSYFPPEDVTLLRAMIDGVQPTLLSPPKIISQPASQTVSAGQSITLNVSASGSAPLTFQWKKDGIAILGATNQMLIFPSVRVSDAGNYSVTVINSAGMETSQVVSLIVTEPLRPVLSNLRQLGEGRVEMVLSGEPGRTYHIDFSTDLKSWNRLSTVNLIQSKIVFSDENASSNFQGFYRAVTD